MKNSLESGIFIEAVLYTSKPGVTRRRGLTHEKHQDLPTTTYIFLQWG
jgi:hypothetical protein